MRNAVTAVTFALLAFVSLQSYAQTAKPALYAITFHADWCGSCKILEPQLIKARDKSELDKQNVLFVKLDLTDKTKRHQSSLMASALGIGDFFQQNDGKTGFVLLVNASTGEQMGRLTKKMDAKQISATISQKIQKL